MRNRLFTIRTAICTLAILSALIGLTALPHATSAQTMDSAIVCDSTLITLLYVAEHDYGFQPMSDVSNIEKGQFKPLFDAMMMGMEGDSMEATPEMGMMESTPDAMMSAEMMQLMPGVVAGEDAACTALRAEIEAFLYSRFTGMMN